MKSNTFPFKVIPYKIEIPLSKEVFFCIYYIHPPPQKCAYTIKRYQPYFTLIGNFRSIHTSI